MWQTGTKAAVLAAILAAAGHVAAAPGAPLAWPAPAEVRELADRVADWQLAHLDDFASYVPTFVHDTEDRRGWVQGALFAGLSAWALHTGNDRYVDFMTRYAEDVGWRLGDRSYHADDHAVGQYYLALYSVDDDPRRIAPTIATFDEILDRPPAVSLEFGTDGACQRRWCWCDALFMAPPVWMTLSGVTGDERYRDYANREYWATVDYLFDEDEGLFYRDSRFFDRRGADGEKIFWSRGNGWVFAGLTRIMDALREMPAMRARYEGLYRQIAATLVELQTDAGHWPVSLLNPERYPAKETSGTGFFTAGLAWGINNGILEGCEYARAALAGWRALVSAVDDDGRLGHVQQVGDAPDKVEPGNTQLYAVGAFLLASTEMQELASRDAPVCDALPRDQAD